MKPTKLIFIFSLLILGLVVLMVVKRAGAYIPIYDDGLLGDYTRCSRGTSCNPPEVCYFGGTFSTGGSCSPVCRGGINSPQLWSKYRFEECRIYFDFANLCVVAAFKKDGDVCSTADKYNYNTSTTLLPGYCDCTAGAKPYKTCCSGNTPVSAIPVNLDNRDPLEGVCPAGSVAKFCGFGGYPECGAPACQTTTTTPPTTGDPYPQCPILAKLSEADVSDFLDYPHSHRYGNCNAPGQCASEQCRHIGTDGVEVVYDETEEIISCPNLRVTYFNVKTGEPPGDVCVNASSSKPWAEKCPETQRNRPVVFEAGAVFEPGLRTVKYKHVWYKWEFEEWRCPEGTILMNDKCYVCPTDYSFRDGYCVSTTSSTTPPIFHSTATAVFACHAEKDTHIIQRGDIDHYKSIDYSDAKPTVLKIDELGTSTRFTPNSSSTSISVSQVFYNTGNYGFTAKITYDDGSDVDEDGPRYGHEGDNKLTNNLNVYDYYCYFGFCARGLGNPPKYKNEKIFPRDTSACEYWRGPAPPPGGGKCRARYGF